MDIFKFRVGLRRALLEQVGEIQNANGWYGWDTTTPNSIIRRSLEATLNEYVTAAGMYGFFVVTRHSNCSNPKHRGYPTTTRNGARIVYRDKGYLWEGGQLFQGQRFCACPCSAKNEPEWHHVIDDVIFKKGIDLEECRRLEFVFLGICAAIGNAGDKQSRSGIREHLLQAILTLNDAILPQTVDAYIASRETGDWPS
ncbi:hypothetical protein EN836_23495 [Mesorhizobium sp. M1C.F.Ca.ET.193.01.1.1]|uniref:hypothetical protein n=1 Tax=unclassified Mesorhizobium TaxID=325217 RepID=UPI000FD41E49|nr:MULTISPECIES: hypothetical protein [unclassified Mesorhizobium]TGS94456.1 hypothetical protein EN820_46365 [bacterium M00.F.Ca.ET.177.01.1.1]TGQ51540.1 hypothetical protein EN853_23485 [Mesorhizobium sp. M1C.F.Ca.ET.210.01.1.1]TGQ67768.1 hypothetical protein EN855_023495 [Mesorhizobium sp. M1C.F.Ca.ET.212.01.1.1]TGR02361.1 hypothetical protein EN847_23485 [Mesorhizobium sp. M1C.F.Ca.ET.204.01.1.1]TGR22903.1 hypothetical protein EN839_23485 [Mesorhizobium sp. M1C.F.Ca.ET.196.01.1.1]